jgi:pSer/pThr/pTyr-binding forkhead associated (FHA) protein
MHAGKARIAKLVNIDTRDEIIIVDQEPIRIGRSGDNDVVLKNMPSASRRHAQIYWRDSSVYIEDLGSTNGTYLNGQRIRGPVGLKNSDRIFMGGFICEYVTEEPKVLSHPSVAVKTPAIGKFAQTVTQFRVRMRSAR